MPKFAIVFRKVGGPGPDVYLPKATVRIQLDCYGANDEEADRLFRTTHPYLVPEMGTAPSGFVASHVQVDWIQAQGGEFPNPEQDTGWPRTTCFYLARYSLIPR